MSKEYLEHGIVVVTKMGKVIKFPLNELPYQKRGGIGVKAITLQQGDEVASSFLVFNFNKE